MKTRLTLAIAFVALLALAPTADATGSSAGTAIEGTWIVDVDTGFDLRPIGQFLALETYSRGGGFVTTNNISRAHGVDVGQGAFRRVGPNRFQVSILFFTFNPDGTRSGSIEISHTVRLTSASTYVGQGDATIRDVNGAVVLSGAFATSGRKMAANQF
jgi:hypothetical protein